MCAAAVVGADTKGPHLDDVALKMVVLQEGEAGLDIRKVEGEKSKRERKGYVTPLLWLVKVCHHFHNG